MRNSLWIFVAVFCGLAGRVHGQTAIVDFPVPNLQIPETNPVVQLVVSRAGDLTSAATVGYGTSNMLATAGLDYVATNGTLSFAAGETNKIISIPILNDGLREGDESFRVELTNPGPGTALGTRTVAVVTIMDKAVGFQ